MSRFNAVGQDAVERARVWTRNVSTLMGLLQGLMDAKSIGGKARLGWEFVKQLTDYYKRDEIFEPSVLKLQMGYALNNPKHFTDSWPKYGYIALGTEPRDKKDTVDADIRIAYSLNSAKDGETREQYKERWTKILYYWLYGSFFIGRQMTGGNLTAHYAINVVPNGTCFWQCLAYALLWKLPVLYVPDTVRKMKAGVIQKLYGKDLVHNPSSYNQNDRLIPRYHSLLEDYFKANFVNPDIVLGDALTALSAKVMQGIGFVSMHAEYAETEAVEMAAVAYDVQIIVYKTSALGAVSISSASLYHATGRGSLVFTEGKEEGSFTYTGKHVVPLLLCSSHYYVLSKYPSFGSTVARQNVPKIISVQKMPERYGYSTSENPEMPRLLACMGCRKPMLP